MPGEIYIFGSALVSPGFAVAGVVLAAIPVVIHFLNRRRFKTVQWAAMEFLLRALKKNQRRLRFEQWVLLAVRCLVLGLLGLALARPMGCDRGAMAALGGKRSALHVFVIDNSYSMAYQADRPGAATHLDQAKKLAGEMIDRFSSGGEAVCVITAGGTASAVIGTPSYDLEGAKGAIARIPQTYGGTDLAGALSKALEIGRAESRQPVKNLYVFTDGTRSAFIGAQAEALKQMGPEVGKMFRTSVFNLGRANQSNGEVVNVRPTSPVLAARMNVDFAATVRGWGSVNEGAVRWTVDDVTVPVNPSVRPGVETPDVVLPGLAIKTGGPHVVTASLVGVGDRLPLDDVRSRVIDVAPVLKVLIVEGERGVGPLGSSGVFVKYALNPTGRPGESYVAPEAISNIELPNKLLTDYRAVILTDVGQVTEAEGDALAAFVKGGGALIIFTGESVDGEGYNAVLGKRGLLPGKMVTRVNSGAEGEGFRFDFNPKGNIHPFLEVFRGEEKSGLDTARTFTYWRVEVEPKLGVERVLNFVRGGEGEETHAKPQATTGAVGRSDGDGSGAADPAITVQAVGKGKVVFVATSAGADSWTSLPARPVFVALMHELLDHAVSSMDGWLNVAVGKAVEVPETLKLDGAPSLVDPNRVVVGMDPVTLADGRVTYRSGVLGRPGVYHLTAGGVVYPVAVSVPAEEGDVRTLDEAGLRKAMGDAEMDYEGDQLPPVGEVASAGNDYGWIVMVGVLGLACGECLLALRAGHHRRRVGG